MRVHVGAIPRDSRIYPVPIKPPSRISRWGDWPEDCVEFIKDAVRGWYPTGGVFVCADCAAYCHPHPYGVPHMKVTDAVVCDDCLIARARPTDDQ